MKQNYWVIGIASIIVLVLVWLAFQEITTSIAPAPTLSGTQSVDGEVLLSWGKFNYAPDVINARVGVPLRIRADLKRITGCYRSFRVPELGVSGYFSPDHATIEFTPQKAGTFVFTCSMGMGRGTLIVA